MKPKVYKMVDLYDALDYLASQDASLDTDAFFEYFTEDRDNETSWPLDYVSELEYPYEQFDRWEGAWGDLQTVYKLLKEEYGKDCYMRISW